MPTDTSVIEASTLSSSPDPMIALNALRTGLKEAFLERDTIIDGMLAAMLAQEHVFLLGSPGTAKTSLSEALTHAIDGRVFVRLLTRTMAPEDLFGPFSAPDLLAGRYVRLIEGFLPTADVAFLDEIWKASGAILNNLLTITHEREFDNGTQRIKVPLKMLIGASNEMPEDGMLAAIYDRLLVRFVVPPVSVGGMHKLLTMNDPNEVMQTKGIKINLPMLHARARQAEVPETIIRALVDLRHALSAENVSVTDRRWRKCLKLLKASATLDGRSIAAPQDLALLGHALWDNPDDAVKVQATCRKFALDPRYTNHRRATTNGTLAEFLDIFRDLNLRLSRTREVDLWMFADEVKELHAMSLKFHATEANMQAMFTTVQQWYQQSHSWSQQGNRPRP